MFVRPEPRGQAEGGRQMKDSRRINRVWEFRNPLGQVFTFARVGTGSNSVIVTLHAGAMTKQDEERVGTCYQ